MGGQTILKRLLALGVGLGVALAGVELALRAFDYYPSRSGSEPGRPTFNEPDPVLGWRNKEGRFIVRAYTRGAADLRVTNWSNGRRATGPVDVLDRQTVAVVGCSYTQGWALSDDETYPWKLQERYPRVKVENYGVAAYGTYQSLLMLERLLERQPLPSVVVYGLLDQHEVRNVGAWWWLRFLSSYTSRGHLDVPYCTLDRSGRLTRHPPERYLTLPFQQQLRTLVLLDEYFMRLRGFGREAHKRTITELLLLEMQKLCASRGIAFVVAMFSSETEEACSHYQRFCLTHGISFVDSCLKLTPDFRVPGDGHPNSRATTIYAENVGRALDGRLQELR